MASSVVLTDLSTSLIDAGNRLLKPPSSTDDLLALLNETESLLKDVEQDQPLSIQHDLAPCKNALMSSELLNHPDSDVRVSLASCLTEITRIAAPQVPYGDEQMKEIFKLTVEAFEKLADASSSRSYVKAQSVLEIVSSVKSCLIMLDLKCDDLVLQMFRIFLRILTSDHPSEVPLWMERIMVTVIDETDEVSTDLLDTLLTSFKKENQLNFSPESRSLAETVLSRCARKLQPYILKDFNLDLYSPVVSSICNTDFATPKAHNAVNTKENEDKLGDVSCLPRLRPRRASSSLGKVAAKKTPQSLTGSVKRNRVSIGESDEEVNEERYEVSEDDRKIKNSSKKKKKVVNSSGKSSSALTDTKKKKEFYTDDFCESLVGQRVNIWWPLDKTFYEGVIESYCSSKKMHMILYTDGDSEELNLINERWDLPSDTVTEDMKKGSGKAREGKNLKSLNAETDRKEEQEDVESQSEDEYYNGEKQEQSGNKSKKSLKVADVEGETKEEEKEDPVRD